MVFVLTGICSSVYVQADDPTWNESLLRKSVENTVNRETRTGGQPPAATRLCYSKIQACSELCEMRIELLKQISKNWLFLPADVLNYLKFGYVADDSYEAKQLLTAAATLKRREEWQPIIDKLIAAYRSIRSQYLYLSTVW